MQSAAQLYSKDAKAIATTLADPCAVLIENSEAHFGLLLAESCGLDACPPDFCLQNVLYFRAARDSVHKRVHFRIDLTRVDGVFAAIDADAGVVLPNCSARAYAVSYLSQGDREELLWHVNRGRESFLFRWAQERFGKLPGFDARDNALTSPGDYATIAPAERR